MIYQEEIKPRISDFDRTGIFSDEALFQVLETAGSHHSDQVNDNVIEGSQNGIAWVLTEWRVEITRRPLSNDILRISTWVRGKAPAAMVWRDFIVSDAWDRELFRAEATFVLLDTGRGRLTRISDELFQSYKPEEKRVFEETSSRLHAPDNVHKTTLLSPHRSDIDFNGHVHNTRYLNLIRETLPEHLADQHFGHIRIAYMKAITIYDEVVARYSENDGTIIIALMVHDTACAIVSLQ